MHEHNAHIKNIKQANEENRLAIFIGAGISKSSDTDYINLPNWEDLITELKADLSVSGEIDYLKLAQLYYLKFDESTYYQKLKSYFPDDIAPSSLHSAILKLRPHTIITTNWDCIVEKAIEKEGYLYDVICSDKDLVKSTSQNKFLKIHGDFKNHNIVFKEDDYLNYSRNFPLIENYIKATLSTHTVLFLGYSYNDVNLKHIMKWIQSHSSATPPMYLVNFEPDKPQESYLRNHGVITITLEGNSFSNNCEEALDRRSRLTKSFILKLLEENTITELSQEREVVDYIFNQIKHLKQQALSTLDQVRKSMTNCGFIYTDNGLNILQLFKPKGVLTTNCCETTRQVHSRFIEILAKLDSLSEKEKNEFYENNKKLVEILLIFSAARIKGVVLEQNRETGETTYFENEFIDEYSIIEEKDREYLSFIPEAKSNSSHVKKLLCDSFESYNKFDFHTAFSKNAELIVVCKKYQIYSTLLIALFNRNSILWHIKYSLSQEPDDELDGEIETNLQDDFFQFPRSEIKKNQVLYDFLSLYSVYQVANECAATLLKLQETIENIKAGGMSFNRNADEPKSNHINLLMFSIKNRIMIDRYAPYRSVMRDFVKIAILRHSLQDSVTFDQYEIYSSIQFFNPKELKQEYKIFEKNSDSNQQAFKVNEKCSEWLVSTVFPNLTSLLIESKNALENYDSQLQNCIRVLSFIDLSASSTSKVMSEFSRLIASNATTIGNYEAINEFLAQQHGLFDRNIETDVLISLLNSLIDKIILRTAHGLDRHAITMQSINNLYSYIHVAKGTYNDEDRVKRLIAELRSYQLEDKRKFARSLLYNIFSISNAKVKNIITDFIENIIKQKTAISLEDWEFDLWSTAAGFKDFNSEAVSNLNKHLDQFRDGKSFSSQLYTLKDLTKYLVLEKGLDSLRGIDEELLHIIKRFQERPNYSSL